MNRTLHHLPMLLTWLVVVFLAFGLFSLTVFNNSHNEQMYVTAAYMLVQGERLYTDFAFVQMPYTPLIYALVYILTGAGYYLLKAKIVNYLFLLLSALLLLWQVRRQTGDGRFTAIVALLFFSNYYLFRTSIEASNYTTPIAFSMLAYVLFVLMIDAHENVQRSGRSNTYARRPGRQPYQPGLDTIDDRLPAPFPTLWVLIMAACGLCLALATGAKLYYVTLFAPFGLAALLYPTHLTWDKRLRLNVLPMAIGAIVGLLPVAIYAWRDWDRFYFNNVGYHVLNTTWREQNGFTDMSFGFKLGVARDLLANPNFLVLVLWLALALLLVQRTPSGARRIHAILPASGAVFLSGALSAVAILTAFTPSPLFPQYFAMPVPFMLAFMSSIYAAMGKETHADREEKDGSENARAILRRFALIAATVTTLVILPRHTSSLRQFFTGDETWSGIESISVSHAIRAHLDANGAFTAPDPSKVATLSPVYALETHLPIYSEFATGSFVYRIGDLLTAEERQRYHAPSVNTLAQMLDSDSPAAILVTQEGDLEVPLETYAQEHGYRQVELEFEDGRLYVR